MLIIAVNKVSNMLGVIKSYADPCYVYTMEYRKVASINVRYKLGNQRSQYTLCTT